MLITIRHHISLRHRHAQALMRAVRAWGVVLSSVVILPLFALFILVATPFLQDIFRGSSSHLLHAQVNTYPFTRLSVKQGLSHEWVYAFTQDTHGFLWIGTEDGLDRFDGTHITNMNRAVNGVELSVPIISSLIIARSGALWIATASGVYRRHAITGHHTSFMLSDGIISDNELTRSARINALVEDKSGTIWCGSTRGLFRLQSGDSVFRKVMSLRTPQGDERIRSMAIDSIGNLWLGYISGDIGVLNISTMNFTPIAYPLTEKKPRSRIQHIMQDNQGNMWISTWRDGVHVYHLKEKRFTLRLSSDTKPALFSHVNAVAQDKHGAYWIGTDAGLFVYNRNTNTAEKCLNIPDNSHTLPARSIASVYCGKNGEMFIGTEGGGIAIYDEASKIFSTYIATQSSKQVQARQGAIVQELQNPVVHSINEEQTPAGEALVYIGTVNGLHELHRASGMMKHYLPEPQNFFSPKNSIRNILRVGTTLWLGTGSGFVLFDSKTKKFSFPLFRSSGKSSLPASVNLSEMILATKIDSSGNIWAGSTYGVYCINPKTLEILRHFSGIQQDKTRDILARDCYTIEIDCRGYVWIGTSQGISIYSPTTHTFRHITPQSLLESSNQSSTKSITSLMTSEVWDIKEDLAGNFWIGTHGSGLLVLDAEYKFLHHFTTKNGLPNNMVYNVRQDRERTIWVSTNKGVSMIRAVGEENKFQVVRNFSEVDGLFGDECNNGALHVGAASGLMYAGGMKGLSEWNPSKMVSTAKSSASMKFTHVALFQKGVANADSAIEIKREYVLPHTSSYLSVEFVAITYSQGTTTEYAHRMDGLDNDWIYDGTQRAVNYTHLPPGDYTLRVAYKLRGGEWVYNANTMSITILPPWWQTSWFRALMLITFFSAVYGFYRVRVRALQKQNIYLDEQVKIRTEQLVSANAKLEEINDELQDANIEISRTNEMLTEQAREIEIQNVTLGELNEKMHASNTELLHANTTIREFMSIASHDLRNPLTGIILTTQILERKLAKQFKAEESPIRELVGSKVAHIVSSCEKMLEIIENYLSIHLNELTAHIDSHNSELETLALKNVEKANTDIRHIVQSSITLMEAMAEQKMIRFEIMIADDIPTVESSSTLCSQIVDNLISNALKYSYPESVVRVSLALEEQHCILTVQDEGQGFHQEELAKVFTQYAEISSVPTGGEKKHGIGLSIVKKIVEMLGGTISVASAGKNTGATFTVRLPHQNSSV